MSQASAAEFLEKANTDPQIVHKIEALGPGAQLEDVLDVAASSGYQFSEQDLMEVAKTKTEAQGNPTDKELSEEELEEVAGGRFSNSIITITNTTVFTITIVKGSVRL